MPTIGKTIKLNTDGSTETTMPTTPDPSKGVSSDYNKQVTDFRNNLPQYQDQLFQGAAGQAKNQLAGTLAGITNNANSRGLLYGGLHEGANTEARAGAAGDLAQQRLNINNVTQGLADQFEQQQLNQSLEKYKGDVDYNQKMYQLAMQQYSNDQSQRAGLVGGIGGLIGAGAGLYGAFK